MAVAATAALSAMALYFPQVAHAQAQAADAADAGDIASLRARALLVPVRGVEAASLRDTYAQSRGAGTRVHEALDIPAERGTPVVAVEDGRIAKLFLSKPGGITVYQFDPGSQYAYYYAHLDRYADGLREGAAVRRGDVIGYVGTTGNAAGGQPHLHFAVFRLGPLRQWWRGTPIDPYLIWHEPPR
jgi:murein DD-endopeptidase MepM/ murein hydrolase activator NlpD